MKSCCSEDYGWKKEYEEGGDMIGPLRKARVNF
jgi:hypothetical protein